MSFVMNGWGGYQNKPSPVKSIGWLGRAGKLALNLAKKAIKTRKASKVTKETKLLTYKPVYRAVDPKLASNIKKPLDFTKLGKHGEPANIAWFGPNRKAYAESGKQIFQANLRYKKPFHVSIDRVWTADKLKNLRGKGHDIIIAGKDQYSQIPLNKDIIKNLKRIK